MPGNPIILSTMPRQTMTDDEWLSLVYSPTIEGRLDSLQAFSVDEWVTLAERESQIGNLESIQSLLAIWQHQGRSLDVFHPAMSVAGKHNQARIAGYLADEGVPITASSLHEAAIGKSTACLDLFFKRGWHINKALQPAYPPVLA